MYSYVVVLLALDENLVLGPMIPLGDHLYFPSPPENEISQAVVEKPLIWLLGGGKVKIPMRVRYQKSV